MTYNLFESAWLIDSNFYPFSESNFGSEKNVFRILGRFVFKFSRAQFHRTICHLEILNFFLLLPEWVLVVFIPFIEIFLPKNDIFVSELHICFFCRRDLRVRRGRVTFTVSLKFDRWESNFFRGERGVGMVMARCIIREINSANRGLKM